MIIHSLLHYKNKTKYIRNIPVGQKSTKSILYDAVKKLKRYTAKRDGMNNAKVIYPLFMKRASLNKKRIDSLSITVCGQLYSRKRMIHIQPK